MTSSGKRPHLANSPFNAAREAAAAQAAPIAVGEQVSHDRHGLGRVVALDGPASVIVDFGKGERRRVALNSPRLERL
ncbi:hypothetical protein [Georgenia ruanii]|uniref:Uncharacterized protein n=1 Tax=Georgenia ruanii TaxID=348442 RepID=A0A7J9UXM1_9MICO|nr:hypothetical protein [Georgenia ruanii]MPV89367.1 hypothetical protein [Georgenia ruanii]